MKLTIGAMTILFAATAVLGMTGCDEKMNAGGEGGATAGTGGSAGSGGMPGGEGTSGGGGVASVLPPTVQGRAITAMPAQSTLSPYFSKYTTVFGVHIVAMQSVPDDKLNHAATIMAEYLDNNEDGTADNDMVVDAMVRARAVLVMAGTFDELEGSGLFESGVIDTLGAQDLSADETNSPGRFDASLEEIWHLISSRGFATVYPDEFGEEAGSSLANAMDIARGGRFTTIPNPYPPQAWYHYDDATCEYNCMVAEYFYWALTSLLGGQQNRCGEIAHEWKLCTPSQVESTDTAIYTLLTDSQYMLPTTLPDGQYR